VRTLAKGSYTWFEKRRKTDALRLAQEQITKALDTATLLYKAVQNAAEGRKEEAKNCIDKLSREEEEVDSLRQQAFRELTNVAVSTEFREDLMHLVKRLDVMADYVKDSARSVIVLLETTAPDEIWSLNVKVAEALVESTTTLRSSIEKLGTDSAKAIELAKKVNEIEGRIDKDYLTTKKLFIKYGRQVDAGTLLTLNNLIEFMEQAADVCADTADYINVLASQG
jgi:predicted phosphate transport protein (TIGR00153 family)